MCLAASTRILIVYLLVNKFTDFSPARCCITMIESATKVCPERNNPNGRPNPDVLISCSSLMLGLGFQNNKYHSFRCTRNDIYKKTINWWVTMFTASSISQCNWDNFGEIIIKLMDYKSKRLQRTTLYAPVSFIADVRTSTLQYQLYSTK